MKYDINIKHLEYFSKVAKLGSINRAAQVLFISQPYLGKIICDLEENMGYKLLIRSRSGVTLTPEGEELLELAENILKSIDNLWSNNTKESKDVETMSVSMTYFSHIMESFSEVVMRHKDAQAFSHSLYEGNAEDVIEDVYSGQASLGVLHFDSRDHKEMMSTLKGKGIKYNFLASVQPHIVISKKHPLILQNKPVTLKNLTDYGFIQYLGQCDDYIYSLFNKSNIDAKDMCSRIIYLSSRSSVMHFVSISDFFCIGIHEFDGQEGNYDAMSVPVTDCDFKLEFGYITKEENQLTDIENEFIASLKSRLYKYIE